MKTNFLLIILVILHGLFSVGALYGGVAYGKPGDSLEVSLLPEGRNLMGFRGNVKEGKIGVVLNPTNSNLKVDVGSSIDLVKFSFDNSTVTLGIDFLAYALSTNTENLRLQIDAIDGLFGGNVTYVYGKNNYKLFSRFRFMHNSAHLVDGNYLTNSIASDWIKPGGPTPFTRDFIEVFLGMTSKIAAFNSRAYVGFEYATHYRPDEQVRLFLNGGMEYFYQGDSWTLFGSDLNIFLSYFGQMNGIEDYNLAHHIQGGVKIGKWDQKGVSFFVSYYDGNDFFNQYYLLKVSRFGIGFEVET